MREERLRLEDIREAIGQIESYTEGGRSVFLDSRLVQDGVIRNFEIIGEAVKGLRQSTCAAHPRIPWSDFARFRDVLIHGYFKLQIHFIWLAVEADLPPLKRVIVRLLKGKTKRRAPEGIRKPAKKRSPSRKKKSG